MSTSFENLEYVQSLRLGDHEVFAEMVREYRPSLMRHARQRVHNEAAADDVVQETFVRAYRFAGRLDDESRIGPWLHQILANVCVDEANRRRRELDKLDRMIGHTPSDHVSPGPEAELGLDTDYADLRTALASLPREHRQALTLRFLDELSYDEVAKSTGVSEQNARARVSRARSAMRHALNGAAAISTTIYLLFRRSRRASAALNQVEAQPPGVGSVYANRVATAMAPAVDATNVLVNTAPAAAPMLGKAAVGAGMLALATFSIAAEPATPRPVEPPIVAAAPAAVEVPAVSTSIAPVVVTVAATVSPVTTAAPTTTELVTTTVAAVVPVVAAPVTTSPPPPTTAAPTTTAAAVQRLGGSLSVGSATVTASGPRLDIGGSGALNVGASSKSGSLSGRLGIDSAAEAPINQRFDGYLTLSLADGGTVEVKLAGFAEASGGGGYTISGLFRATGDLGVLVSSGSFSGYVGTGSLSLDLSS